MEKRNPIIQELIEVVTKHHDFEQLEEAKGGELNQLIDAKANQKGIEKAFEAVEGADSEEAKRIKFYRDIISGKLKTTKTTVRKDKDGNVIGTTKVTENDVKVRMEARKELDRLLGLNTVIELDKFNVGSISVHIVDASRKEIDATPENIDKLDATKGDDIEAEPIIEGEFEESEEEEDE